MSRQVTKPATGALPDHTQLPDKDGKPVDNEQQPLQAVLLTESITPVLRRLHPDSRYFIGEDCGIYWRSAGPPEPLLRRVIAPDWYYVPGVDPIPPDPIGFRRSYVLWRELVPPLVVLEFASGAGDEERDQTPGEGKFWIYEQRIQAPYYGIYEVIPGRVAVFRRVRGHYRRQRPNERGHYPIKELGVELGIWRGQVRHLNLPWLRWFDTEGRLLLSDAERAEQERREKEQAQRRAERLAERLRELGIDPEA